MATVTQSGPRLRRFNWWKVGFFVALFAFEVAREVAVLEGAEGPTLMTSASVFTYKGWTVAEGSWRRIDDGDKLVPAAVRIECDQSQGECTEVTVNVYDQAVWSPKMETFKARFAPDAITYENKSPSCVHYIIRIDLRLKKVIGVRERTTDNSTICRGMEQRIEMQLGDGWDLTAQKNEMDGHFLPVLQLVVVVVNLFD